MGSSRISGEVAARDSRTRIVCRTFDAAIVKLLWHLVSILSVTLQTRRIAAEVLNLLIVEWSVKCLQGISSLTTAATDVLLRDVCLAGFHRYVLMLKSIVAKNRPTLPLSYPLARCNYSTTISSYILTVCDIVGRIRQSQWI